MSETALKFGPEWLRVLSHGGSVSSPPPSPGIKFKLAEHRYGREEMLALFNKHQPPPDGIQTLGSLYVEEPQDPLAFIAMNEEEQRMWQRCVNSDAVLRQSGRPPANGVGRGRGGSVDRGRGRGRGAGSYYTRGLSYDEDSEPRGPREGGPPGMTLRSKPFERSQSVHEQRSWGDRSTGNTGAPPTPEERNGAVSPRKEQGRASTENWRNRGGEDETDRWRGVGSSGRGEKWGSRGWRERERENELESEWDEGSGRGTGRGVPVSSRTSRPPWEEKDGRLRKSWDEDNLPEWATENADEKGGSFDALGAFHGPGWSDEEDPTAGEGRGGVGRARQRQSPDKTKKVDRPTENKSEHMRESDDDDDDDEMKDRTNGIADDVRQKTPPVCDIDKGRESQKPPVIVDKQDKSENNSTPEEPSTPQEDHPHHHSHHPHHIPPSLPNGIVSDEEETNEVSIAQPEFQVAPSPVHSNQPPLPPQPPIQMDPGIPFPPQEFQAEEEKLEHMRSVADDLVAKLVEEDDLRPQTGSPSQVGVPPVSIGPIPPDPTAHNNHVSHTPGDDKWYYTDPQGEVQGPFSSSDMAEWYRAGYFTNTLLLKRECDDQFASLGELMRIFSRVPFAPGPPILPHKVTDMINAQKRAERERIEMLQNYMIQNQMYQHQMAVSRQQVLAKLQSMDEWNTFTPQQQQNLFIQQLMTVMPAQPMTLPNVPQTTAPPPTVIPSSTPVSVPAPDPRVLAGPDMRVMPPGPPVQPSVSKPQDPIQALVAQMTSSPASSTVTPLINTAAPLVNSADNLLTSQIQTNSAPVSMAGENPLQKLILQLQRGQQPGPIGPGPIGNQPAPIGVPVPVTGVSVATSVGGGCPMDNTPTSQPPPPLPPNPPTEQQFDAIQSLMQQLTKMQPPQTPDNIQEEHQRRQEEDQKRLEERRRLEEQKRKEDERIKMEELRIKEELKRQEEQIRNLEAIRRKHEEETQRIEEENRKIREEQLRREEELRRLEEEKKKEEDQKRKLQDQQRAEAKRRQEELRRQQQQQQQKQQQEEAKRKEEVRREEEARRQQEEERKRKEEEEERKRREEEEARQQAQIQEELRRMALEEERRRMQQLEEEERIQQAKEEERRQHHLLQEHLKNMLPAWNTPPPVQAPEETPAPSLIDIQRAQEEKERKEREIEQQLHQQRQREAQRQAAEEARQKNSGLKWAAVVPSSTPSAPPVKSLLEIQAEEEKELKKVLYEITRQEKEAAERAAAVSHMSIGAAGVWGSAISNLSWASRASSGKSPSSAVAVTTPSQSSQQWVGGANNNSNTGGGIWNSNSSQQPVAATPAPSHTVWNNDHTTIWNQADASNSTGGFWDNPEVAKKSPAPPSGRTPTKPTNAGNKGPSNNRSNKKKSKDEDVVKKLFTDNMTPADDFTRWCKGALNQLKVQASIDIPTFVTFLAEVESPYEVHDYIRSYLGDSKEVKEFAKQYLERRSRARNAQKEREVEDDILAPAPAINPTSAEFQEVKQLKSKKGKKKMQKVDSSILGFNVSSNERINVGERDYVE